MLLMQGAESLKDGWWSCRWRCIKIIMIIIKLYRKTTYSTDRLHLHIKLILRKKKYVKKVKKNILFKTPPHKIQILLVKHSLVWSVVGSFAHFLLSFFNLYDKWEIQICLKLFQWNLIFYIKRFFHFVCLYSDFILGFFSSSSDK